jgi:hypothetical protein
MVGRSQNCQKKEGKTEKKIEKKLQTFGTPPGV